METKRQPAKFNKRQIRNDYRKPLKSGGIDQLKEKYPEHIINIALIVKNNAEIRRFTAIGIINYLKRNNVITSNTNRVSFKWNKFSVISDNLVTEYRYNEQFFINALVASFTNFSASAQRIIDTFCNIENNKSITENVNAEEVNEIVNSNEEYISSKINAIEVDVETEY